MSDEKKKKSSLRINTNISNLTELTGQNLKRVNSALQTSLERLSTGLKINTGEKSPVLEVEVEPISYDEVMYDELGHVIVDVDDTARSQRVDAQA